MTPDELTSMADTLRAVESALLARGLDATADAVWRARCSLQSAARSMRETPEAVVERLADSIAQAAGIPVTALLGAGRHRSVVRHRDQLCLRLRDKGWSYPAIGRALGRHHTTIIAAVRRARGVDGAW
jgi:chromosomal replication initiation ATPase DnaA